MAASFSDGTSQPARLRPALDPASAPLDERGVADGLAFARAFAGELVYIDDSGRPQGDWRAMFPEPDAFHEAVDYLRDPAAFDQARAAPYARPHFALLLAFLDLLGLARDRLNDLTRRHLDHFYLDVLRMVRKPAVPDRVHVLMPPDQRTPRLHVPAGTLLEAGKDEAGRLRRYRTVQSLDASAVRVAELRSVRADIRVTGVREAARAHLLRGTRQQAFVAMWRIALGLPEPGGPLPVPVLPGLPPAAPTGQPPAEVGFDTLVQAHELLRFVAQRLWLPLFDEFRRLAVLARRRAAQDSADWAEVNALLARAGQRRDPAFRLQPQRADDFHANLRSALGLGEAAYAKLYDRLPEVASIEDAYALLAQRADVQAFVQRELHLPLDEFRQLMQAKRRIDGEWEEIAALAQTAGARRQPGFEWPEALRARHDLDALLAAALGGPPAWPVAGGLAGLHDALLAIERYFCMSAERFDFVMAVGRRSLALPDSVDYASAADEADWARVYAYCKEAHAELVYRRRREALRAAAAAALAAGDAAAALAAMLQRALGEPLPIAEAGARLATLGVGAADLAWLGALAAQPPASIDWDRAATVLEVAQRNREGLAPPVPEQRRWFHLYPAADARQLTVQDLGGAADEATPRWRPFGSLAAARRREPAAAEAIGWGLASPLLALAEGQRSVVLLLGLDGDPARFDAAALRRLLAPPDGAGNVATVLPFRVQLSGAEGWVEPASVQLAWAGPGMAGYPAVDGEDSSGLRALQLSLTLSDQQPAIVPAEAALHGLDAEAPVLRLMLRPFWNAEAGCHDSAWQALSRLRLCRLRLSVAVTGLAALSLRSDQSVIDPKQPFEPFGSQPASGARLSIAHPELVAKPLASIAFRFSWMGAPAALDQHYANYAGNLDARSFTVRIGLRQGGLFSAPEPVLPLFDRAGSAAPVRLAPALPTDPGEPAPPPQPLPDPAAWPRCWVWELVGDFQHSSYPAQALQLAGKLSAAVARGEKPDSSKFLLNPPYTPKLKSLQVDYSAVVEQPALVEAGRARSGVQVLHLHPFGDEALRPPSGPVAADALPGASLLPAFEDEGALFIGLARVQAPQRLSLLFQCAEGSADPDVAPPPLQWQVLSGDRWCSLQSGAFEGSLLADGTRGLVNAGIVELQLPPVAPSTLMPGASPAGGLYWLRVAAARGTAAACDLVDLHPHAVLACREPADGGAEGDDDAPARPLPPLQIQGTAEPLPGLGAVRQPYSAFGGRPAEADALFRTRVSERLRHRQRALAPWDYERLVLERFPQLHKVKCLAAGGGQAVVVEPGMPVADAAAAALAPALVELIVVPDITHRFPFNPFAPKASADLIRDIEAWLADKTPPAARVRVRNAHFLALKVRCGVRFTPGSDEGYCRQRLNDDLNRFLSPWAYDEGADLVIGGSLYANSVIHFLEQRPYVDFIAGLKLFLGEGERFTLVPETPGYHASVARPDTVLVAAASHEFDVIAATDFRVQGFGGVGHMRIELDFIVG